MKTTISLLVLFALVLGGGYAYNKQATEKSIEESASTDTASYAGSTTENTEVTTASTVNTAPSPAPATGAQGEVTAGTLSNPPAAGTYTLAQVAAHGSSENCWTTINGNVYNLTDWIAKHPGGAGRIIAICGKDGSKAFGGQHGSNQDAQAALANFKIGVLAS